MIYERGKSENELLFPENSVCKFVGYLKTRVGSAKLKYWDSNFHIEDYLKESTEHERNYVRSLFTDKAMISGGFGAIYENLRQMAEDNEDKFTYEDMCYAATQRIDKIALPYMGKIKSYSLNKVRVNPDAFSGHVSSLCAGRTRRASNDFSNIVSSRMLKKIFKKRINSMDVWRFGAKPKAAKLCSENKILKARPIALCDDVVVKLGSFTSQRITEKIKYTKYSELFIGKPLSRQDMEWIVETLNRDDVFFACPDWSQYDNYIYEEVLVIACGIISQCYDEETANSNYFHYITSSIVDKHIVADPGVVYKLMKGLPSGHPFTSLVNTVANWVLWSTIFYKCSQESGLALDDRWRCICSGDDTLISFPMNLDTQLINKYARLSGMKLDDINDAIRPLFTDESINGVHFLRRQFHKFGGTCWDDEYIFDRLRYVDNAKENKPQIYERVSNYLLTANADAPVTRTLTRFSLWLRKHSDIHGGHYCPKSIELADIIVNERMEKWRLKYIEGGEFYQHTLWQAITKQAKTTYKLKFNDLMSSTWMTPSWRHFNKLLFKRKDPKFWVQKCLQYRMFPDACVRGIFSSSRSPP